MSATRPRGFAAHVVALICALLLPAGAAAAPLLGSNFDSNDGDQVPAGVAPLVVRDWQDVATAPRLTTNLDNQARRRLLHRRRQGGHAERVELQHVGRRLRSREVRPRRHVVAERADADGVDPARVVRARGRQRQHVHHVRAQPDRRAKWTNAVGALDPLPHRRRPAARLRRRRLDDRRDDLSLDGLGRAGGLPGRRHRHVRLVVGGQQRHDERRRRHELPVAGHRRRERRGRPLRRGADRRRGRARLDGRHRLLLLRLGAGAHAHLDVDLLGAHRQRPAGRDARRELRGQRQRLRRRERRRRPQRRRDGRRRPHGLRRRRRRRHPRPRRAVRDDRPHRLLRHPDDAHGRHASRPARGPRRPDLHDARRLRVQRDVHGRRHEQRRQRLRPVRRRRRSPARSSSTSNGDGVRQAGENTPIAGRTVFHDADDDGFHDPGEPSAVTAAGRRLHGRRPAPGHRAHPLAGRRRLGLQRSGRLRAHVPRRRRRRRDAAATSSPSSAPSVGGTVYADADADANRDGGEGGLGGMVVGLYAADGTTLLATTVTGPGGGYGFSTADVPGLRPAAMSCGSPRRPACTARRRAPRRSR